MNATQVTQPELSPFVPTYAAIFCSAEGVPQIVGVFTIDEFLARWNVAKQAFRWAILLNTETGAVIGNYNRLVETEEKIA